MVCPQLVESLAVGYGKVLLVRWAHSCVRYDARPWRLCRWTALSWTGVLTVSCGFAMSGVGVLPEGQLSGGGFFVSLRCQSPELGASTMASGQCHK